MNSFFLCNLVDKCMYSRDEDLGMWQRSRRDWKNIRWYLNNDKCNKYFTCITLVNKARLERYFVNAIKRRKNISKGLFLCLQCLQSYQIIKVATSSRLVNKKYKYFLVIKTVNLSLSFNFHTRQNVTKTDKEKRKTWTRLKRCLTKGLCISHYCSYHRLI